jgi:hypothetical protein
LGPSKLLLYIFKNKKNKKIKTQKYFWFTNKRVATCQNIRGTIRGVSGYNGLSFDL